MSTKKAAKTHTSTRKKKLASPASSAPAKKAASKRSQLAAKTKSTKPKKAKKNGERPAWLKKRDELTLKIFQIAYESHQRGEFWRF